MFWPILVHLQLYLGNKPQLYSLLSDQALIDARATPLLFKKHLNKVKDSTIFTTTKICLALVLYICETEAFHFFQWLILKYTVHSDIVHLVWIFIF